MNATRSDAGAPDDGRERRTLVLIRHAKAQEPGSVQDHDRALTTRGQDDARALGRWLHEQDVLPSQVICSTALRTRQTWAAAAEGSGDGALVDHEPKVYEAGVATLLGLLRQADADAQAVALVGHAPGVPHLAAELAGESDPEAADALAQGFPTATVAVLEVEGAWSDLAFGAARLVAVHTARAGRRD